MPTTSSRARLPLLALALFTAVACGPVEAASSAATSVASATAASLTDAAPADTARDSLIARADRGRIRGRADAVWLVVISDFQCPYCKQWHDESEGRIERDYVRTGKLQVAYINYPIPSLHANAPAAHDAAMCASEQGRFWPMADALFATQGAWKGRRDAATYFDSLAGTLEVDRARYRACVRDGSTRPLIAADIDRATRSGAGSTPTFFIGGRQILGAQPYEAFQRAIDAALAAAAANPAR